MANWPWVSLYSYVTLASAPLALFQPDSPGYILGQVTALARSPLKLRQKISYNHRVVKRVTMSEKVSDYMDKAG